MTWEDMGWDEMGWNGTEWIGWNGFGWEGLDWFGLHGMGWVGWDGMGQDGDGDRVGCGGVAWDEDLHAACTHAGVRIQMGLAQNSLLPPLPAWWVSSVWWARRLARWARKVFALFQPSPGDMRSSGRHITTGGPFSRSKDDSCASGSARATSPSIHLTMVSAFAVSASEVL